MRTSETTVVTATTSGATGTRAPAPQRPGNDRGQAVGHGVTTLALVAPVDLPDPAPVPGTVAPDLPSHLPPSPTAVDVVGPVARTSVGPATAAPASRPPTTRWYRWSTRLTPPAPLLLGATSGGAGAVLTGVLVPGVGATSLAVLALLWAVLLVLASGHVARAAVVLGSASWAVSTLTVPPVQAPTLLAFSAAVTALAAAHGWLREVRLAARTTRVVLVGSRTAVRATLAQLHDTPGHHLEVGGVCVTDPGQDGGSDLADLDDAGIATGLGLDQLPRLVEDAEAVLALPGPDLGPRTLRSLGWQLDACGTQLLVGTGLVGLGRSRTRATRAGEIGLLAVRPVSTLGPGRVVKSAWERVAALLALVLLAPLLGVLVLAIRRGSAGPAIFRQARVGRDGRVFTMFKLRTMTTDAEHHEAALRTTHAADEVLFKLVHDPRVTGLGRWLRRYSLDEVPQLVNVVLGHMSLVGPRPALPSEVLGYDAYPRRRLAVKPGLTGLWQVSGRSDLSWDDAVRLDLDYVDNWSLGRDLVIIGRTVGAVLTHRGAY